MRRRLADGLGEHYPSYDLLELFLIDHVGRELARITAPDALPLVVHRVLVAARAGGWLADLVEAAADDSPHSAAFRDVRAALRTAVPPAVAVLAVTDLDVVVVGPSRLHALAEALRADDRVGRVGCLPSVEAARSCLDAADALVVSTEAPAPDGPLPAARLLPVVLVETPAPGSGRPVAASLAGPVTQIVVAGEPEETARRIVDHLVAVVTR
jgi:Effector-associated domain 1